MATGRAPGARLASEPLLLSHPGPVVLAVDLPAVPPLALWDLVPGGEATFWRPPGGPAIASAGAALRVPLRPTGDGRSTDEALAELGRRLRRLDPPRELLDAAPGAARPGDPDLRGPRLFGGAAFGGSPESGEWAGFGPGEVVLPEWTLEEVAGGSRLGVAFPADRDAEAVRRRLREAARLIARLGAAGVNAPPAGRLPAVAGRTDLDPATWRAMVDAGRAAIRAGGLRKVVLARRSEVRFDGPIDPVPVLRRLARSEEEFVFGVRRGDAAFVGASPETLLRRDGDRLRVEALAGTSRLPAGGDRADRLARAAERLYGSGKDLEEHALVVQGIAEALAPFAVRRDLPGWPRVRGLGELAHLSSEIEVELREGVGTAALLGVLHPTPAVGGLPRAGALDLIRELEPVERGWYAGPVGWVRTDGAAELAVGIRSALLRADTAWLYAGAGIVAASEPDAEYRETGDKLGRLLAALGAEGARA